jgi:hypothetical protein
MRKPSTLSLDRLIASGPTSRKLGISSEGVSYLVRIGKLNFVEIGGQRFFDETEVEKLARLRARERETHA